MSSTTKLVFLTNSELGAANINLAVCHELLSQPSLEIHIISFASLEKAVSELSHRITFHALPGLSLTQNFEQRSRGSWSQVMVGRPGINGAIKGYQAIETFAAAWPAKEHIELYTTTTTLIRDIDPKLVVLDPVFIPGVEAVRDLGVKQVILCPNPLKDLLGALQPRAEMLWKYPATCSGFSFPVPLHLIPANIYLVFRLIFTLVFSSALRAKTAALKQAGIEPAPPFTTPSGKADEAPWLFPSLPETDLPLTVIPECAHACGPIIKPCDSVESASPELAQWLALTRTIVINLGSLYRYDEHSAKEMLGAIQYLLQEMPAVQVLWKLRASSSTEPWLVALQESIKADPRIYVTPWIPAEMAAVLAHENVLVAVHHGGASSYHEAISAGVPQVVLPMWNDLYDNKTRAVFLGVGEWGNRTNAPGWEKRELGGVLVKVVRDAERGGVMTSKAKELAKLCPPEKGRQVAAAKILEML